MEGSENRRLISRQEVEDRYGIPKRFLEKAVAAGGGPPMVKVGRSVRYSPAAVERWIDTGGDMAGERDGRR